MQPSNESHHSGRRPTPNVLGDTAMEDLTGASTLRRPDPLSGRAQDDKTSSAYSRASDGSRSPVAPSARDNRSGPNHAQSAAAAPAPDPGVRPNPSTNALADGTAKLKQTHYLDPATVDRLDEVIHALKRQSRREARRAANSSKIPPRVNLSTFIELAVTLALDDFERNGVQSEIAQRLLNGPPF